jgi:predicted nuclease of restriction endonuclease-like RecB superfamily
MLTGKMVRVRYSRDRVHPCFIDANDPALLEVAGRLLEIFGARQGHTRGELEQELQEAVGEEAGTLVHQGLIKLLEDRCEFEVVSGHPPEELRAAVFAAAAQARQRREEEQGRRGAEEQEALRPSLGQEAAAAFSPAPPLRCSSADLASFDRDAILRQVAGRLALAPQELEQGLFADLKSQQRLMRFQETTPQRILQRYNVGLAQAVLLRSTRVHVTLGNEPPPRYRSLLRQAKFHRLVCELERLEVNNYRLHLDGPLSLFTATQKYGLQLALFLPAVLHCRDWLLEAELHWGAQRKRKLLRLSPADGLVSHGPDTGVWVPPEMGMFAELFRKRIGDWDLAEETDVFPLGDGFWVPDFRLTHRSSGRVVRLEVLGFWRRASAERHLARLRDHASELFLLAVSEQLRIDEAGLHDLPAGIHRFRNMPLPDEIARLARELISTGPH